MSGSRSPISKSRLSGVGPVLVIRPCGKNPPNESNSASLPIRAVLGSQVVYTCNAYASISDAAQSRSLRDGIPGAARTSTINPYMWNGPRCKCALQSISPHQDGAVICPACLRDHRPLASMKSAKQVAGSRGRAFCASRVSAWPVSGFRPVVHRLHCTLHLPAVTGQITLTVVPLRWNRGLLHLHGIAIYPTSVQQCPYHPGDFIGERNGHDLERTSGQHILQPRPCSIVISDMT